MVCAIPLEFSGQRTWDADIRSVPSSPGGESVFSPPETPCFTPRKSTPEHARARQSTPEHARARQSTSEHVRARQSTPEHAREKKIPQKKSPPEKFPQKKKFPQEKKSPRNDVSVLPLERTHVDTIHPPTPRKNTRGSSTMYPSIIHHPPCPPTAPVVYT